MFFAKDYSEYDAEGLPLKDAKGKELSESIRNKLKKEWNKQDGVHKKWLQES